MLTEFNLKLDPPELVDADLLAVGVKPGVLNTRPLERLDGALKGEVLKEITRRGFDGRAGTSIVLPAYGAIAARNLLLFGLGIEDDAQKFRLLGESAVQTANSLRARTVAL